MIYSGLWKSNRAASTGSKKVERRSDWVWISTVLGVALLLRVIKLNSSLWLDEVLTLVEYVRLPTRELITTLTSFNNHVLYSLEAQLAIAVFGESAWSLRLPAMLFGVAGVGALWWFARQVVSRWEANMAALLLAVSYHHIWFSQNARGYTELMFWGLIGTGLFVRGLQKPTRGIWLGYGCVLAAAMYTHLSAAFFFGTHAIVYAVLLIRAIHVDNKIDRAARDNRNSGIMPLLGFAFGAMLVVLLHAPLLPQIVANVGSVSTGSAAAVAQWKNPLWTLLEIFRNLQSLGMLATVAVPAGIAFVTVGVFSLGWRHRVLTAIFLAYVPLTLVCLLLLSFRIWPRYFFIGLGFIFLFVVHGVFVVASYLTNLAGILQSSSLKGERAGVIACCGAVFCSLFLLPANYRYPKQDFLGARDFVEAARQPGDTVATIGLASFPFSRYYAPHWKVAKSWRDIQEIRGPGGSIWLVYTSSLYMAENYPDVLKGVASDFQLVKRFPGTLGDGTVFVYRSQ